MNETLQKSIDEMIDELFVEVDENEQLIEKSLDIAKDSATTADEAASKAPKAQKDEARDAGRPKQISDVPQVDQDGKRDSSYDDSISESAKEKDVEEADQVKEMNQIKARGGDNAKKPASAPFKKSEDSEIIISKDEYEEFKALKKAKADQEAESFRKAEEARQEDLIKSIVERTADRISSKYEDEISSLKKSLSESNKMLQAIAKSPKSSKSITNIESLEKSVDGGSRTPKSEYFSKSEMLDAAEELAKANEISMTEVIELENNGYIYNPISRKKLEDYLSRKN